MQIILLAVVFLVVGGAVGYLARRYSASKKFGSVEERINKQIADAETRAKEIVLEAKEKSASLLGEVKNEEKERRKEIDALEARLLNKEETLDKRSVDLSTESARKRMRSIHAWKQSPDFP
jgi:ribonuclease Y